MKLARPAGPAGLPPAPCRLSEVVGAAASWPVLAVLAELALPGGPSGETYAPTPMPALTLKGLAAVKGPPREAVIPVLAGLAAVEPLGEACTESLPELAAL